MRDPTDFSLVLLADDKPANLAVLEQVLAGEAIQIAFATDGNMVLELVKNEVPDLILLDVLMPGMGGFETCRRLKADPTTREIPVIFMTSLNETAYRLEGLQLGAVDYLAKPFDEAELLARVRTQLTLRRTMRTLQAQNERLAEQTSERAAAESAREVLTQQLLRRTEELRLANERLEQELHRREQAELARAQLQEQVIAAQRDRLLEMSTPLIPITEHIVVMPLIGTLDAERAQRALETVLFGASERRAQFVILDITGLREVDDSVASLLVRAATALRLLGARAVITGIRPEVARVLASRSISLAATETKATLKDGIAYAMATQTRSAHLATAVPLAGLAAAKINS